METIHTLIFFACCFAVLYLYAWWGWQVFVVRPRLDIFKGHGVTLSIDRASKQLIYEDGVSEKLSIPFNSVDIDFFETMETKHYQKWHRGSPARVNMVTLGGVSSGTVSPAIEGFMETGSREVSTGFTKVSLTLRVIPLYHSQSWKDAYHGLTVSGLDDHLKPKGMYLPQSNVATKAALRFNLPNRKASAMKRWVKAHQKLIKPSVESSRKVWDEMSQALLAKCRSQRGPATQSGCLELFDFSGHPAIQYLRIENNGRMFAALGENPFLLPIDRKQVSILYSYPEERVSSVVVCDERLERVSFRNLNDADAIKAKQMLTESTNSV